MLSLVSNFDVNGLAAFIFCCLLYQLFCFLYTPVYQRGSTGPDKTTATTTTTD